MKCPGCGSETSQTEGPTHDYMTSSPGCWKVFGDILQKEFSHPFYMRVHRLTVDAFACQHVGGADPRAKQSVVVHLLALCLAIESKVPFSEIPPIMVAVIFGRHGKMSMDAFARLPVHSLKNLNDLVTGQHLLESFFKR